mmetsp:Transcript_142127/g.441980  ORF Transcript_142127/g.441980 Transcript_142127/m.441980 type:complete len:205 (-) Transcript_142127:744-1358(-)
MRAETVIQAGRLPAKLHACLPTRQRARMLANLPACQLAGKPASPHASKQASQPTSSREFSKSERGSAPRASVAQLRIVRGSAEASIVLSKARPCACTHTHPPTHAGTGERAPLDNRHLWPGVPVGPRPHLRSSCRQDSGARVRGKPGSASCHRLCQRTASSRSRGAHDCMGVFGRSPPPPDPPGIWYTCPPWGLTACWHWYRSA